MRETIYRDDAIRTVLSMKGEGLNGWGEVLVCRDDVCERLAKVPPTGQRTQDAYNGNLEK